MKFFAGLVASMLAVPAAFAQETYPKWSLNGLLLKIPPVKYWSQGNWLMVIASVIVFVVAVRLAYVVTMIAYTKFFKKRKKQQAVEEETG